MWISARYLPAAIFLRNFSQMLRYTETKPCDRYTGISADLVAAAAIKVTRRPWVIRERRCLRQGLIGYRCLRKAGYEPKLHVGVDPGLINQEHISAHCWIVLNGKAIINDAMLGFSTIHIHPNEVSSAET